MIEDDGFCHCDDDADPVCPICDAAIPDEALKAMGVHVELCEKLAYLRNSPTVGSAFRLPCGHVVAERTPNEHYRAPIQQKLVDGYKKPLPGGGVVMGFGTVEKPDPYYDALKAAAATFDASDIPVYPQTFHAPGLEVEDEIVSVSGTGETWDGDKWVPTDEVFPYGNGVIQPPHHPRWNLN